MNIYFSGIGGVGIGPLAEIAHDAGYNVTGSDPVESLMSKQLERKGIEIDKAQDGGYLQKYHDENHIDWFVHTSALTKDNLELTLAKKMGLKTAKRDELLAHIIEDKELKLIAVAGTHGKTSTVGMAIWSLMQMGIPISYSIGTTISFGPSGQFEPDSKYFVYECDEFDRNFLKFKPYLAIITSIDFDHPDTYQTEQDYLDAFREFALSSEIIITWQDQHSEIFVGLGNVNLLNPGDIKKLAIPGTHNRRNATIMQTALAKIGLEVSNEIIESFPGVDRRFEKLADNLYSDYGHHPIEIASTLQLAREISDHVVLVYQPHQNIRQHKIKDSYTNQFELADEIYWLPTYLSREDSGLSILEPAELIQNITNKSEVHVTDFGDELWSNIEKSRKDDRLVLVMGAGEIDNWVRNRLAGTQPPMTTSA